MLFISYYDTGTANPFDGVSKAGFSVPAFTDPDPDQQFDGEFIK